MPSFITDKEPFPYENGLPITRLGSRFIHNLPAGLYLTDVLSRWPLFTVHEFELDIITFTQ